MTRYLHVTGDRATPNPNHIPDGTEIYQTKFPKGGDRKSRQHKNQSARTGALIPGAEAYCQAHAFALRTVQRWCDLLEQDKFIEKKNAVLKKCWQLIRSDTALRGKVLGMSKTISVIVPHQLGKPGARHQISDGIPKFKPTFGAVANLEQATWDEGGDTLSFKVHVVGASVTGTIVVMDDHAKVEANLPAGLAYFAKAAEGLIQRHGERLAAPTQATQEIEKRRTEPKPTEADRREVRRKAREAAQAVGHDWSKLPREARRPFIKQARKARQNPE
ncbi:MAG: hypothetical protein GEU91_17840 [Rhizobiales bacterium]|nr:hypothetical protein [Hyphomicrobiales bacterium]